jgi:hypothetical protein
MAAVKNAKTGLSAWGNEKNRIRVVYDFAKDGGAQGNLDLATFSEAVLITDCIAIAKTGVTSGGSATVSVGQVSDEAGVIAATAKASLAAGLVAWPAARDASHVIPAAGKLVMAIGTADLTAGVIEFIIEYVRQVADNGAA